MSDNRKNDGKHQQGGDKGASRDHSTKLRDSVKKSENTVSFDRPTPQKPKKD